MSPILSDNGISIEAILQKPAHEAGTVPVIILTKPVVEREMNRAIGSLEAWQILLRPWFVFV